MADRGFGAGVGDQGIDGGLSPAAVLGGVWSNAGLGIVVADPERRILDCNPFVVEWLGYSRAELLERTIADISEPEDEIRNREFAAELSARGRTSFQMEKRYRRRDGEVVWGLLTVSWVPAAPQAASLMVGVIQDITDRKTAEQALVRGAEKLRSILRAAPTGIGLVVERVIREANDRLCAMLGYRRDELLGQSARLLYPSDADFSYVGEEKYRQIGLSGTGTVETRWLRADGRIIDVLLSSTPIDPQDLAQGVTFTALDITERKRAEQALRESEERYRLLFELESDALFIIDNESGRILEANRAAEELYGRPREALLALRNEDLSAEPEDTRRQTRAAPPDDHIVRVPLRWHRHRDGTVFPVEITARFFEWRGRPVHLAAIRDVGERHRAQEEQRRLESQVRHVQKLESLGVLAGGIAHDFNNLLMAILGNADLALLRLDPDHPAHTNVREIGTASERAAELCRQMLAYSGKGHFVLERVDLSALVRELGQMLQVSISKKATVEYRLEPGLPAVKGDPSQLGQVVMNLISNASEALQEESGTITVVTGQRECAADCFDGNYLGEMPPPGRYVLLEVADSGVGMDAATRDRVFDPFFSTKFAGRGLGLAAVLGIVRGHGGAVQVLSEPGAGSRFQVFLPALPATAAAPRSPDPEPAQSAPPGLVLLVDDEESVRTVGEQMIAALGHRVITARDGAEAVETFRGRQAEITCVLLDLTMPRMGGEETLRALRALRSDLPVILSSGYSEQEVVARIGGQEPTGFIQKPYTLDRLREVLAVCRSD